MVFDNSEVDSCVQPAPILLRNPVGVVACHVPFSKFAMTGENPNTTVTLGELGAGSKPTPSLICLPFGLPSF